MAIVAGSDIQMTRGRERFEQVAAQQYEGLRPAVLTTVRGKLAADGLHPDPSDLEAAYNAAWHALYEQFLRDGTEVGNLGGWLATIAYRRAIDEIRRSRLRLRVANTGDGPNPATDGSYEPDLDARIASREKYRQWLMSVRLRLNAREQQAVSLRVLHEHSRQQASDIMGVDIKRFDKIMLVANKKLGGLLEAINRGDWCEDQRSLIKAYAFGLHDEDGERHALAARHVRECSACAAYVRSVRGLSVLVPAPTLLGGGAAGAGGGILGALTGIFKGGAGGGAASGGAGTAAGGGGATLLGGVGAKSAALCVTAVCAAGGVLIIDERGPKPDPRAPDAATSRPSPASGGGVPAASTRPTTTRRRTKRSSGGSGRRAAPDPKSQGAQEIAELGIEPQATDTSPARESPSSLEPRPAAATEFGIEGP